jgi:hypothetical protein
MGSKFPFFRQQELVLKDAEWIHSFLGKALAGSEGWRVGRENRE